MLGYLKDEKSKCSTKSQDDKRIACVASQDCTEGSSGMCYQNQCFYKKREVKRIACVASQDCTEGSSGMCYQNQCFYKKR